MSDNAIIAICASLPPTIAALAALWVAISNAKKADAAIAKVDVVTTKVDVVHALTNDAKSKADAALAVANETIKGLQMLNASLQRPPAAPAEQAVSVQRRAASPEQ